MSTRSATRVSSTRSGFWIRVEGRGTLRESPAVHALVCQLLDSESVTAVLDLAACDYLDSTFLGAVVDLHRRYSIADPGRFLVSASTEARDRLFGPNCLETLFRYAEEGIEPLGGGFELPALALGRDDLGRHVLECHRRLVEQGGPNQAAMEGVVERLADELFSR
jgi:anti-anti-sigma regulatory factor